MKRTAMLLAGGMISAGLVGGPAQASGSDDPDDVNACGADYVLAGHTKIEGPTGRESLGKIVQTTNPDTLDACTFVVLKKDRGTTGTLTVTVRTAGAETPEGTWDTTTPTDTAIDLGESFVSPPTYLAAADVSRASVTVDIVGEALQGKQHGKKRLVVVPATKAEKKAALKAYKDAVKAARKALRKHDDDDRYDRAVKRARDRRDDKLDGRKKHVIVQVGVATPFTTTATHEFELATAVPTPDDDSDEPVVDPMQG